MSLLAHEERDIENLHADFEDMLAKNDWDNAHAAIKAVREKFGDFTANIMVKSLIRAQEKVIEPVWVPYEHPQPPVLERGWQEPAGKEYVMDEKIELTEIRHRDEMQRKVTQD